MSGHSSLHHHRKPLRVPWGSKETRPAHGRLYALAFIAMSQCRDTHRYGRLEAKKTSSIKFWTSPSMVAHAWNPNTQKGRGQWIINSAPASNTDWSCLKKQKTYFLEARVEVLWFSLFVYYQNKIFKLFKHRTRASGFCFNVCTALAIQHNPSAVPAPNNPLLLEAKVKSQN